MPFAVRMGIASFDDVISSLRIGVWDADMVLVSWDKRHQTAAVMGMLDSDGRPLEVPADLLARLTGLLAKPLPPDVLRIAFPEADLHRSGMVTLNVPVHEPVWARALDSVGMRVEAGLRVSSDDIRDALWVTLEAASLPNGSFTVERTVMFPELPDDIVFEPATLATESNGRGGVLTWRDCLAAFPHPEIPRQVTMLMNELAVRHERELHLQGSPVVLTTVDVNL